MFFNNTLKKDNCFRRLATVVLFFMLVSFLDACGNTKYKMLYDDSEICSIRIVRYDPECIQNKKNEQKSIDVLEVLCSIDDKEEIENFLIDFYALKCSYVYSDPLSLISERMCIVFIYNNNDWILLSYDGENKCISGIERYSTGRYGFDKTEFDTLIEKHVGKQ